MGVDIGLRGMCVGDQRRLFIPTSLAYGEVGLDIRVQYWKHVIYDVTMLKVFIFSIYLLIFFRFCSYVLNFVLDFHY